MPPGDLSAASQSRSRSRVEALRAEISDVSILGTLLRPVAFATVATISASEAGLKVTTEADRSVQAIAYVSAAIFASFRFELPPEEQSDTYQSSELDASPPALEFDVNLHTLLECINIFGGASSSGSLGNRRDLNGFTDRFARGGSPRQREDDEQRTATYKGLHPARDETRATSMKMSWRGVGSPLILLLQEQEVTTRCELATFEPGYNLGLLYSNEDTQAQAIMTSEYLLDALQSIDSSSCSKVTLLFSNSYSSSRDRKKQRRASNSQSTSLGMSSSMESAGVGQSMFKISSDGDFGTAETEFPNDISVLEKFTCARDTINSYRWSHFSRLIKALNYSIRASIRVAENGLLCIQLMMPKGTGDSDGPSARSHTAMAAAKGMKGQKDTGNGLQGHGFLEFLIAPLDLEEEYGESKQSDDQDEQEDGVGVGGNEDDEEERRPPQGHPEPRFSQLGKRDRTKGEDTSFEDDTLSD